MTIRIGLCAALIGALMLLTNVAQAQDGPVMLKAPPPGQTEFPACCKWCPAGGCTNCNSGPQGLNCGPGLIKAECSMKDNVVHCKKAESRSGDSAPKRLKTN